ncbi:MAG: hypothetical protein DRI01_09400 [Chloroflexi bacterium]|nr:MAG: hypothetical protein DRI01_09400 [Chloroflexota bacterium]
MEGRKICNSLLIVLRERHDAVYVDVSYQKGDLRLGENFCSAGFVSQRYYCVSCGVRHLIKTVKTLVEILAYISEGD